MMQVFCKLQRRSFLSPSRPTIQQGSRFHNGQTSAQRPSKNETRRGTGCSRHVTLPTDKRTTRWRASHRESLKTQRNGTGESTATRWTRRQRSAKFGRRSRSGVRRKDRFRHSRRETWCTTTTSPRQNCSQRSLPAPVQTATSRPSS